MGGGIGTLEQHGNGVDRQTHNHVLSISPPRARSSLEFTETSLNHLADTMKFTETFLNHLVASIALPAHSCPSRMSAWEREEREGWLETCGDGAGNATKVTRVARLTR